MAFATYGARRGGRCRADSALCGLLADINSAVCRRLHRGEPPAGAALARPACGAARGGHCKGDRALSRSMTEPRHRCLQAATSR